MYVIPPAVIKSARGRYRQSGARTDQSDAEVIADEVRTNRGQLQPWRPDSPLTRHMRAQVSWVRQLTHMVVRGSNQLRAVLLRYYPAGLNVFSDVTTLIGLAFIQAYPTPQMAAKLSYADFRAFARQHRYPCPRKLSKNYARLQQSYAEATPETVQVFQGVAVELAQVLEGLVRTKNRGLSELERMYKRHPDYALFKSLPGVGRYLGPALLVKFGDDRERFPQASSVQALAGTCPVTDKSGKRKVVKFRYSCDREFRDIAQNWALASRSESIWANTYWLNIRPHCDSDSHAYRCLANRWLGIVWTLWQTHQEYDESYHMQQLAQRRKPR